MEDENLTQGNDEALTQHDTESDLDVDLSEDETDETDWKAEAEKKDQAYRDQKKRAEIAENKLKGRKEANDAPKADGTLSVKDQYALQKSNIDIGDIDEVIEFARYKKISVADALQSGTLKAILSENSEKRNVAQASHSGSSRRSTAKMSDDALVANAKRGVLPETDEELERLFELRSRKAAR